VQARLDAGERPHFLGETRRIRESNWKVRCCSKEAFPILCPFSMYVWPKLALQPFKLLSSTCNNPPLFLMDAVVPCLSTFSRFIRAMHCLVGRC
jgi:hypothetical protein